MSTVTETFVEVYLTETREWTEGLSTLVFPRPLDFDFTPGQYIRIGLVIDDELTVRPYSVASSPDADQLELYISASADEYQRPMSTRLAQLNRGDSIQLDTSGAYGFLTIDEVPDGKHLWLLASGVGLAPFLSMLRYGEVFDRFDRVYLVHSCRYAVELGYAQEMRQLENLHTGLRYLPFITREIQSGINQGRVTSALYDGTLEATTGNTIDQHDQFMICGNPGFVDDCTSILRTRGLARNRRRTPGNITVEKFW